MERPRNRFRLVTCALLSIALVVCATPIRSASAQSIARAERQYLSADFDNARAGFRAVLASPTLERAQAADAHRYLAAIELAFGHAAAARTHLEAALLLARDVTLPSGAEGLEPVLAELRAAIGPRTGLHISTRGPIVAGRGARIIARLDPAPAVLATRIVLRCGPSATRSGSLPEVSVSVRPGAAGVVECTAELETEAGAVVLSTRRTWSVGEPAAPGRAGRGASTRREDQRGWPAWPFLVGGGVLVAVGVITAVAVAASSGPGEAFVGRPEVDGW